MRARVVDDMRGAPLVERRGTERSCANWLRSFSKLPFCAERDLTSVYVVGVKPRNQSGRICSTGRAVDSAAESARVHDVKACYSAGTAVCVPFCSFFRSFCAQQQAEIVGKAEIPRQNLPNGLCGWCCRDLGETTRTGGSLFTKPTLTMLTHKD